MVMATPLMPQVCNISNTLPHLSTMQIINQLTFNSDPCPTFPYALLKKQVLSLIGAYAYERTELGHDIPVYKGMKSNTISRKEVSKEQNKVMMLPVIILLILIITFIGLQAYYMLSTAMQP